MRPAVDQPHHKTPEGKRAAARAILSRCNVPVGANFFVLTNAQVVDLLAEADIAKYRKPANANGSRGRYYHDKLQREAQRNR